MWSIDASAPLFGLKFTILFITCLVLCLILIPFNLILLFNRSLLRFRIINRFKPILDAFQGSYKDQYYYWIAVYLVLRSLLFALYGFELNIRLILATIILALFTVYSGYNHPYKSKLINIQELLLLLNLTIMYAVSYPCVESVFSIVLNIMISMAFIQFCIILLYHIITYMCLCDVQLALSHVKQKLIRLFSITHLSSNSSSDPLLDMPEDMFYLDEYQDEINNNENQDN